MNIKKLGFSLTVLVAATAVFLSIGGPAALASGLRNGVQSFQSSNIWAQRKPLLEINDHHFGVGVRVHNPNRSLNFDRKIQYLDLGSVENLVEDLAPFSAQAIVNGQVFDFTRNSRGELEVIVPAEAFNVLSGNDVAITGYDRIGQELGVFEMGGCYFL